MVGKQHSHTTGLLAGRMADIALVLDAVGLPEPVPVEIVAGGAVAEYGGNGLWVAAVRWVKCCSTSMWLCGRGDACSTDPETPGLLWKQRSSCSGCFE